MSGLKYTKENIEEAVKNSTSIAETMRKLGIGYISGGMHYHISKRIKEFKINISHFTGSVKCKREYKRISADEILVYNRLKIRREPRRNLLRAMIEKGKEYICKECGLKDNWNGKEIILHIDHINGDPLDNRIDNLRFLCPNCHSQTKTFSTNKLVSIHENYRNELNNKEPKKCNKCQKEISKGSKGLCKSCASIERNKSYIRFEVTKEELRDLMKENTLTSLGKKFGVSGNAVKKRAKKYGLI